MTTAIISIATALLLFGVLYLGDWEWIGEKVAQLLPKAPLTAGEKVVIFLNGEYNRTATVVSYSISTSNHNLWRIRRYFQAHYHLNHILIFNGML